MCFTGCVHGRIEFLVRSRVELYRNLDVLDIILAENKGVIIYIAGGRTAAPVLNLERLIDGRTALGFYLTVAVDITPHVELTVILDFDITAGKHMDTSVGTGRGTVISAHLSLGTKLTVSTDRAAGGNRDLCIRLHRQSAERRRRSVIAVCHFGFICKHCAGSVKRNQKRNTGRDGIISLRKRTIRRKNNSFYSSALRKRDRRVQIGKAAGTDFKHRSGALIKQRSYRHISARL